MPPPRGRERRDRVLHLRVLVAEHEQAIRRPAAHERVELHRLGDLRNIEDAALFGRLDRIRPHARQIDALGLGVARQNGQKPRGAHLDRLLHHVVEPRMLERRKHIMKVRGCGLLARALENAERGAFLARGRELRPPFALAPVEHQHVAARLEAQHVDEIVRLLALERNLAAGGECGVHKKSRGAEIVTRHGVGLSRRAVPIQPAKAKFASDSESLPCYGRICSR